MLGVHVSKKSKVLDQPLLKNRKSLLDALVCDLETLELNSAQIFTHGPRSTAANAIDYKAVHDWCKQHKITLVVHTSYATPGFWTNATKDSHLLAQLEASARLGAYGVVVHLPKALISNIVHVIVRVLGEAAAAAARPLLLECVAVREGPSARLFSYSTPEQINGLADALEAAGVPAAAWGMCIDTAHLWASGVDIRTPAAMRAWLAALRRPSVVKLVHLNGCSLGRGVGRDVHEIPWCRRDLIGSAADPRRTGLYVLYEWCVDHRVPVIIEVNRGTQREVETCLAILQKKKSGL
jgi:endonuclease IV